MPGETEQALVPLSFWAVGRFVDTAEVVIKLNGFSPVCMTVENARESAAALKSEADTLTTKHSGGRFVARSAQVTKKGK
jgi:hypothetical protein